MHLKIRTLVQIKISWTLNWNVAIPAWLITSNKFSKSYCLKTFESRQIAETILAYRKKVLVIYTLKNWACSSIPLWCRACLLWTKIAFKWIFPRPLLKRFNRNSDFWRKIVTVYETWTHHYKRRKNSQHSVPERVNLFRKRQRRFHRPGR